MLKKTILPLAVCVAVLSACSSAPTAKDIAREEAAAAKVRADAQKERNAIAQKEAEKYLNTVPAWIIEPPRADDSGLYAIGIGDSKKLDLALNKAKLNAEFNLAKQYKQVFSGSERSYQRDGGSNITERYSVLIDKLIDRVPIVGYEIVKREVKPKDGIFNVYVLLKLPYDEYNRVLESQRNRESDKTIDQAFDEMERRLKQYRKDVSEKDALEKGRQPSQAAIPAVAEQMPAEGRNAASASSLAPVENISMKAGANPSPRRGAGQFEEDAGHLEPEEMPWGGQFIEIDKSARPPSQS